MVLLLLLWIVTHALSENRPWKVDNNSQKKNTFDQFSASMRYDYWGGPVVWTCHFLRFLVQVVFDVVPALGPLNVPPQQFQSSDKSFFSPFFSLLVKVKKKKANKKEETHWFRHTLPLSQKKREKKKKSLPHNGPQLGAHWVALTGLPTSPSTSILESPVEVRCAQVTFVWSGFVSQWIYTFFLLSLRLHGFSVYTCSRILFFFQFSLSIFPHFLHTYRSICIFSSSFFQPQRWQNAQI